MRWIDYIRVLFPSWRFFERPSSVIQIEIKYSKDEWRIVSFLELAKTHLKTSSPHFLSFNNLLYNPTHNFALYLEGYVHELSVQIASLESEEASNIVACSNFNFTHNIIQSYATAKIENWSVEYKLCSYNLDGNRDCFLHYVGER